MTGADFRHSYERHKSLLYRFAVRMTGSNDMAEDLVHGCFLLLWSNRIEYRPERGSFAASSAVAYGVATEAEARADVRELAARMSDLVKIWVDDRGGTVPKLTPPLNRAISDEAHKNQPRVAAHIFHLSDGEGTIAVRD